MWPYTNEEAEWLDRAAPQPNGRPSAADEDAGAVFIPC